MVDSSAQISAPSREFPYFQLKCIHTQSHSLRENYFVCVKKTYIVNLYPLIHFLIFNFLCFVYTTDYQGGVTIQAAPALLVNVKKMKCKYQTLV